jgi:putative ABC transport system permease protein
MLRRRRRPPSDFASEMQSHIELEVDRLRAEGMSVEEARWRARRSFGNVLQSEERFYESRRALWLDHLKRDFVYAVRQLGKNKTFATVAVLTLALGIGATAAIFTLLDAALLRPLPYQNGDRIVYISDVRLQGRSTGGLVGVPRFFDLQRMSKSYDSLAFSYFDQPTLIAGSSVPVPLLGAGVGGDFWKTIGIRPALGRAFNQADDRPNSPQVAIISYAAWQRIFRGDPRVLNRQVTLDGKPATIVGILPPHLEYPGKVEIWTPSHFDPVQWTWRGEGSRFVSVLGRLKQNVSFASAQEELKIVSERLRREHPDTEANWRFGSEPLRTFLYGSVRPALLVLMAASGVLLLIACINVANLLLSRGTTRMAEVSLRRALGASQVHILAQFLTENALLALAGGGLGLLVAYLAVRWFGPSLPGRLGRSDISINWPIVWFTFSISALTGIVFGCLPAIQARHLDLNTNLKQGDIRVGRAAGNRLRMAFVSAQVALSLVLLIGASLLAESLWNLIKSPLGFRPDHVLTFEIKLPWNGNPAVVKRFFDELERRIEALPGVTAVGQVSALPMKDWHLRSNFDVDWKPRTPHGDAVNVEDRAVGGEYFRAMGIPLIAGRYFTDADQRAKPPKAIVNQQFVEQYSPNGNPIGRHLINKMTPFEIIGVVRNVRGTNGSIAAPPGPEFYFLSDANDVRRTFVVRSPLPSDPLIRAIREQVHAIDPTQAMRDIATLNELLDQSVAQPRFNMGLLSAFAVAAMILACVGIYGVVAYSVAQRSLEIGIRMALGATRKDIMRLVMRRTLFAALIGIAIGGIAAAFLTRLLRSELYGVQPDHFLTFAVSALLLLSPVLVASLVPAVKAALLNPAATLRTN